MRRPWISVIVVMIGLTGSSLAMSQTPDPNSIRQPKPTPALNLGKMNYQVYCASCHGKTTEGTDKGPTFLHRVYHPGHHSDQAFYSAPIKGARAHHWQFGDMKPVEGITEDKLNSIVPYIRAVQKENGLF